MLYLLWRHHSPATEKKFKVVERFFSGANEVKNVGYFKTWGTPIGYPIGVPIWCAFKKMQTRTNYCKRIKSRYSPLKWEEIAKMYQKLQFQSMKANEDFFFPGACFIFKCRSSKYFSDCHRSFQQIFFKVFGLHLKDQEYNFVNKTWSFLFFPHFARLFLQSFVGTPETFLSNQNLSQPDIFFSLLHSKK